MSDRTLAARLPGLLLPRLKVLAVAMTGALWLAACTTPPAADPGDDGEAAPAVPTPSTQGPSGTPGTSATPGTYGTQPSQPFVLTPPGPSTGVSPPPPTLPLPTTARFIRSPWNALPGWQTDTVEDTWVAFLRNCDAIVTRAGKTVATNASAWVATGPWLPVCTAAKDLSRRGPQAGQVRRFLEDRLEPWVVGTARGDAVTGLVTGYYEPLVQASRVQGGVFQWPLYTAPADLLTIDLGSMYPELTGKRVRGKLVGNRVVPYDSRAEIENSPQRPPAIVYVNDPVDAFFLQVQGSGRAELIDGPNRGGVIRLAYADHNGHPYVSIGKWLVDQGQLTLAQDSMQNIKAWARANPGRVREMLNANPAMVFFREEAINDVGDGPRGAFGVPLTPGRSIAVDPSIVPLGSPVFLATTYPNSNQPLTHMAFAQDTGAAIKGAARADMFWGFGAQAGEQAGRMKQPGKMWVLWPRGSAPQSAR